MTTRPLPDGASLENLKKQAKSLLKSLRAGDAKGLQRIAPYFTDTASVGLSEIQLVVAREYGFDSWDKLNSHVYGGLSKDLEATLQQSFKEAREKRHQFVTVEHLLLALLDNSSGVDVLRAVGTDLEKLRKDLDEFIDSTTPSIPASESERETQPTVAFQRVLQRAVFHVRSAGRKEVTGVNVLVSIFSENETTAIRLLKQQNIARNDVVNYIVHGTTATEAGRRARSANGVEDGPTQEAIRPTSPHAADATEKSSRQDGPDFEPLKTAEEARFARQIHRSDAARHKMIEGHLPLVAKIARRYLNRRLPLVDLIEEGKLGLIRAVDKFDPERGFLFSDYATGWIREAMERGIAERGERQ
jgi:hypothetical protein